MGKLRDLSGLERHMDSHAPAGLDRRFAPDFLNDRVSSALPDRLFELSSWMMVAKFRRRFAHVEEGVAASGKTLREATMEQMESLWQDAKRQKG